MTVYVDKLVPCRPTANWPFSFSCHMIADNTIELHAMARKIGLKRSWYQCGSILPHYDLTATKRRQAILMGAVSIDKREVWRRIQAARALEETHGNSGI